MQRARSVSSPYFTLVKKLLCPAFSILLLCNAAQAKISDAVQLLFLKNHVSAGFAFPVTLAKQESHTGLGEFEMRTLPGFSMQFDYAYNFNPYIGIASGSRMGIKNFGYHAAATPGEFAIQKTVSRDYVQMIPFFSIPLLLTPRFFISKRSLLQADVGGSITFFIPAGTINTLNYFDGTDMKRVFEMKLFYQDRPLFMLHAGLSYGLILKSENILKICCSIDYGRSRAIEGHYTFYGDDMKVGYGKMYSSLSSVEMGISYVFTRAAGIRKS
ncbi:MAG: hypothetical protein SH857_08790 [Chitinophagales bacterium]|nr:hypothetical protein [Chitinophagales bacterium]